MNKKTLTLALFASFAVRAQVQAYGAVPLILYAVGSSLIHIEDYPPKEETDVHEEITQRAIKENITFAEVIGAQNAKDALLDIVNALKHPEVYKNIGAKMPKGVLLEGPPGNGKTLLAKALAGEADVSFIAINGADFGEKYLGDGPKKVKELFEQARAKAPCIIFIDEIDALGTRGAEFGGGAQTENNRVITELLTQLDGMNTDSDQPIIVVAATNCKDRIDSALIRSGRIDIAVAVEQPTLAERKELLQFYGSKAKLSTTIDFNALAQRTKNFSAADCQNLVNQAALSAVRRNATCIEQRDFIEALETRNIQKR